MADTQESRTKRGHVMLTPTEKRALRGLALLRGVTESDLLRPRVDEIVREYERVRSVAERSA